VGAVLLKYLVKNPHHSLICLDYANKNAIKTLKVNNIEFIDNAYYEPQKILEEIKDADIVVIHWWNHPLLYDFLVRQTLPHSRVIIWSHVTGFHPPYVFTEKILSYPDLFVFNTPINFETQEVIKFKNKDKLYTVWATGGIDHVKNINKISHQGFNIGYIGTVDYCKMHPDFLKICSRVNIPEVKFIVCGGASHNELKLEAQNMGIADKFEFTGLIPDIAKYLGKFDIFGYPLADYHYGTCDQVLQEAMAAGVVPVVLSNSMERYMVKNGVTGIIADNEEDYIKALEYLYKNPDYRKKLSINAKEYALENFSLEKMCFEWEKTFEKVLKLPKKQRKWTLNIGNPSAMDIFLESLGKYGDDFRFNRIEKIKEYSKSPVWQAKTRGTPHHYLKFFPDDENLSYFSKILMINKL
jgi:glycosyltransferase involved in cell wall biosynthesis